MSYDAIEIYNQGYCYYTGTDGYPLNYHKALECFQKAAELGVSHAMNYLGLIYEGEVMKNAGVQTHPQHMKRMPEDSRLMILCQGMRIYIPDNFQPNTLLNLCQTLKKL